MNIAEMLDQLADYRAARDALNLRKQDAIEALLSEEQKAKIREIDTEYADMQERVEEQASELEARIKDETLSNCKLTRGSRLMAIWNKPRITWDTPMLEGMMSLIPQIRDARKEGAPSVTIRVIG